MSRPMNEWVSGKLSFHLFVCLYIQPFSSDFTHRYFSAPGSDGDTLTPHTTLTPLLREWAKAKLTLDLWRDALLSAVSVSISFCSRTRRGIKFCVTRCWFVLVRTSQGYDIPGRM